MKKRHLTRRQKHRIQQNQARIHSEQPTASLNDYQTEKHQGTVIAHFGNTITLNYQNQAVSCYVRSTLPAIVTGDLVYFHLAKHDPRQGIITSLEKRRSLLSRPDSRGRLKPVAANIDQVIIVISPSPKTPLNLIDRYLVAAEHTQATPVIVLNKMDLLDEDSSLLEGLQQYKTLGYHVVQTCAINEKIRNLTHYTQQGNSILVGQSGVGKSSLIQQLVSTEHDIKIGEISDANNKGRHTTTTTKLYPMKSGGFLIDSPGIREFGLWHTTQNTVLAGFPEIEAAAQYCKFNDCTHQHEPHCRVQLEVQQGTILARRLESYHSILASLNEVDIHTLL